MDADPAIFVIDLQDANKKLTKKSFSAFYFFMVHFNRVFFSKTQFKDIVQPEKGGGVKRGTSRFALHNRRCF